MLLEHMSILCPIGQTGGFWLPQMEPKNLYAIAQTEKISIPQKDSAWMQLNSEQVDFHSWKKYGEVLFSL